MEEGSIISEVKIGKRKNWKSILLILIKSRKFLDVNLCDSLRKQTMY